MSDLDASLRAIEDALDQGTYRRGAWQSFLDAADRAPAAERARLADAVDRVSEKLHRRAGRPTAPVERALGLEILATFLGLACLALGAGADSVIPVVVAAALLATTFQPLLKVGTGFALGLGYAYAYLAGVEPRFKLRYGRYLAAPRWRRVVLHLSGALGSPFALWLVAMPSWEVHDIAARVLIALAIAHLVLQLVLFGAALAGVRRAPAVGLLSLTSAGAAGHALRGAVAPRPARA
jgi:hypothetical protein